MVDVAKGHIPIIMLLFCFPNIFAFQIQFNTSNKKRGEFAGDISSDDGVRISSGLPTL